MRVADDGGLEFCCDCHGRAAASVVYATTDTLFPFCDSCWQKCSEGFVMKAISLEEAKLLLVKSKL